jgi:RNA polymerase sigma factor (sigma-70 family)
MNDTDSSPSNSDLVQGCLNGDALAWEQLVQRFAPLVHGVAVRYGLAAVEVDDIGQEVFLALAQNLAHLKDPERLPAWLLTTTRRFCWRLLQVRHQEQLLAEQEAGGEGVRWPAEFISTPGDLVLSWHRQDLLQQGLQRLSEECRQLLTLIFLDPSEPTYAEISARLQMPTGSIGPTRIRCLQRLRYILEGLGYERDN